MQLLIDLLNNFKLLIFNIMFDNSFKINPTIFVREIKIHPKGYG